MLVNTKSNYKYGCHAILRDAWSIFDMYFFYGSSISNSEEVPNLEIFLSKYYKLGLCVCVCIYIHMYMYVCIYTYVYIHMYI